MVTLHKNTFEPDTGVRTCVLFLSKPLEDDPVPGDYTIFMAQSRRVGKDSKGEPVFALDEKGSATSELDEDLTQIAEAYKTFRDIGTFTESETCFTAERGELDDNLNLNPQHYSPELNATLEKSANSTTNPIGRSPPSANSTRTSASTWGHDGAHEASSSKTQATRRI